MSSVSPQPDNSFFDEFLDDFFAESDEHLASIRRNLLALEPFVGQPRVDQALLEELFRSFHSLKGLSGTVGLGDAERLAHEIESYVRALRGQRLLLHPAALDTLFDGVHMLEQVLVAARERQTGPAVEAVLVALSALVGDDAELSPAAPTPAASADPQVEPGAPVWHFRFVPGPALAERGVTVNAVRARLERIGTILDARPLIEPGSGIAFAFDVATTSDEAAFQPWADDGLSWRRATLVAPDAAGSQPAVTATSAARPTTSLVRVELQRLDDLMQGVADLVITRSRLTERLHSVAAQIDGTTWRELQEISAALGRQLRDLREGVVRARMVPIGDLFTRMQLAARDVARELGKQLRLDLRGQETAIDKYIVERLSDPLLQLVRNAVGHGLELPAERVAQGKPAIGLITLSASASGDSVTIALSDDGRGVDAERVVERARVLGYAVPDAPLDDAQLLELLCAPGFSTRDEADRLSGRGIGMDIVRQTVAELGGALRLTTTPGQGSTFTLQLPLTLTIVDAMIVAVGDQRFAVPLPSVQAAVEIEPAAVSRLENNELLRDREQVLPLLRLGRAFGIPNGSAERFALLFAQAGKPIAVAVDRLLDKREIVVRPLADPLLRVAGLSGATELGDGRVVLILDAAGLTDLAQRGGRARSGPQPAVGRMPSPMQTPVAESESYILFELAGATYGIPSRDVLHIDMVEQVTPMPNAAPALDGVVLVRGRLVPLLNLRVCFGFARQPLDLRSRVIVIRRGGRDVGLLVDAAREFVRLPADAFQPPPSALAELRGDYLSAIATLGQRVILILKLDEVLALAEEFRPQSATNDQGEPGQ